MSQALVPVHYATRLLDQAQRAGCTLEELYKQLDVDDEYFRARKEVSALKYGEIYQLVMRSAQDEWFGIFADGKVPLGAFRLMCLTLLSCSDLRQAIVRAGEFAEICRGLHVRYILSFEDELARLTLAPSRTMPQAEFDKKVEKADPETIAASLITWHRLSEWLIGIEIPVKKAIVTFSKALDFMPFEFPKADLFEHAGEANAFFYDQKYLDYPIVQNQNSLMAFLRTAPYHLVTEDPVHISTADKVRNILKRDVSGNMPSAEAVASQLNVSVTTLRRQLQRDDTSYQRLKDGCRMEAAFHFLGCLDLSNNDIAEMLGFDEPSAFFRSFKKWTGQTPGEYRASIKRDG